MTKTMTETQLQPAEVLKWLTPKFAGWLELPVEQLEAGRPMSSYGLDSISAVTLTVQLEEELGIELETELLFKRPTLQSLAEHLAESLNAEGKQLP